MITYAMVHVYKYGNIPWQVPECNEFQNMLQARLAGSDRDYRIIVVSVDFPSMAE